jgi:hypothetical protein
MIRNKTSGSTVCGPVRNLLQMGCHFSPTYADRSFPETTTVSFLYSFTARLGWDERAVSATFISAQVAEVRIL